LTAIFRLPFDNCHNNIVGSQRAARTEGRRICIYKEPFVSQTTPVAARIKTIVLYHFYHQKVLGKEDPTATKRWLTN